MVAPDCLFCRIVEGGVPADVVRQTSSSLAFRDRVPQAPTHVLVVPRRHVTNLGELAEHPDELADVVALARDVAQQEGLERGYRLVANTGSQAGQTVYHAHLHVLGGRDLDWPPG
ncbi:MAG: histidine triad nucleotide-binding protein [Actinomycetota bacterium]|nr:histidine triad nucleotide-binding protein [Actinomycetota bacterium]